MRGTTLRTLLPLSVLLLVLAAARGAPIAPGPAGFAEGERDRLLAKASPGLTREEAQRLLGPPARRGRQGVYQHCREQWVYDAPLNLRLEFESAHGGEPRLSAVQSLRPARP